ncbi:monothiol glutaredoxin-5, partial [Fomitiporia mediterranea MF3/22]|uniref:monothiol glutaredoxin-5 n=1 Tax=Fomitiporia mediterranea (strain MF3/22) TaxID=694068 RepID=UPI0004408D85
LSSSLRATSGFARASQPVRLGTTLQRYLSQDARSKLQAAVKERPLVVFMKGTPELPQCGFSRAVIQLLDINGVPSDKLKTYDVLEDQDLRNEIKEFSEWPTIPQVYVNGEFVGGCDIILGMHQSGELESLLRKHNIVPKTEEAEQSAA